ncbi:MAG: phosphate ABC transporter permease [Gammaproteobacteria bacterium GWF2_41_13]|nr:MAG: phosphate ABC transporter permease [Gammaproteobacteria bacterium GWF2_41_13]
MKSENTLIIEAGRAEKHYWLDLWRYRELFYILSWRDITVRYKQTVIGVLWAILKPFLTMVIFTIIFGRLAKLPSDGNTPYAIMVYAAMIPWQFFSSAISDASSSIVDNAQLISKVYFPRIIVPISSIVTNFIDFLISFVILIILMIYFRFMPSWHMVFLPVFFMIAVLTAAGIGTYITSLNVKYRDFRYIIPFLVQLGLYVSPVGFSSSVIPGKYRLLYSLNPMVGVIDGFRWAILGGKSAIYLPGFLMSLGVMLFFLILGVYTFRKMEKTFADVI